MTSPNETVAQKLSSAEIRQAKGLQMAVKNAIQAVEVANRSLLRAATADVDEASSLWATLQGNFDRAEARLEKAVKAETEWWESKGYTPGPQAEEA